MGNNNKDALCCKWRGGTMCRWCEMRYITDKWNVKERLITCICCSSSEFIYHYFQCKNIGFLDFWSGIEVIKETSHADATE